MNVKKPPISAIEVRSLPSNAVFRSEKTEVLQSKSPQLSMDGVVNFEVGNSKSENSTANRVNTEFVTKMSHEHNSLLSKWKPITKKKYILPKNLLEKVTSIIQMVYTTNENISFNQVVDIHSETIKLTSSKVVRKTSKNSFDKQVIEKQTKTKPFSKITVKMTDVKEEQASTHSKSKFKRSEVNTQRYTVKGQKTDTKSIKKENVIKNENNRKSVQQGHTVKQNSQSMMTVKRLAVPYKTSLRGMHNKTDKDTETYCLVNVNARDKKRKDLNVENKSENNSTEDKKKKNGKPTSKFNTHVKGHKLNEEKILNKVLLTEHDIDLEKGDNKRMQGNCIKLAKPLESHITDDIEDDFLPMISTDVLQSDTSNEDFGPYNLEDLFKGILDNKYEKWKKRDNRQAKKKARNYHDDKKERRKPPNYFVAIQITNPEIIRGIRDVQTSMCKSNENLKKAMIPIPTLHLTLRVACLENDEEISRMIKALDQCVETFNKDNKEMITLDVKDIESFRNEVVFANLQKDECLSKVIKLSDILEECCQTNDVPPSDGKGFTPHITIAKLTKLPFKLKKKVKKIDPSTYRSYKNNQFGKQLVTCLQLCSMYKPKDRAGYYHVSHLTPMLKYRQYTTYSRENYTIADAAHILVTTVISETILRLNRRCNDALNEKKTCHNDSNGNKPARLNQFNI
ncbi:AKAP7 [Mytilus coruscus]|uniref:AKAP7 n=1 Tax=Mytilus coruscus TaxID=42192 RepID=A0A6J8DT75_MYTCO|nr:AKAP7 [Mytilus coruscus]